MEMEKSLPVGERGLSPPQREREREDLLTDERKKANSYKYTRGRDSGGSLPQ